MRFSALGSVLLVTFAVACGSSADGPASGNTSPLSNDDQAAPPAPLSLIDGCEREFDCRSRPSDPPFLVRGVREGAGCRIDDVVLAPDGSVHAAQGLADVSGTWTGNADAFDDCWSQGGPYPQGPVCDHCQPSSSVPAREPPSSGSTCTGAPRSCSSGVPGACSDIRGCYLSTGYGQSKCAGVATPCSELYDESSCKAQGCTWR